jgi:hypothetical protein
MEDESVAPKPVSGGSLAREVDEQLTAADRALLAQRQLPPDAGGLMEAMIQDAMNGVRVSPFGDVFVTSGYRPD